MLIKLNLFKPVVNSDIIVDPDSAPKNKSSRGRGRKGRGGRFNPPRNSRGLRAGEVSSLFDEANLTDVRVEQVSVSQLPFNEIVVVSGGSNWPSIVARPIISFIAWNCQGLGQALTVQALSELNRRYCPSIIFLSETCMEGSRMDVLRNKLGFDSSYYVQPLGTSGGLGLWWKHEIHLEV